MPAIYPETDLRSAYYDNNQHGQYQQEGYYDDRGQQGYQDEYYNDQYYDQGGAHQGDGQNGYGFVSPT
jgi:1,3-beta-glucan synthase